MDDAGVVRLSDDVALVQTVDIFPPVVDDPFWFGRIAAANALSDIYAMGARPVSAVNFIGFPMDKLDGEVMGQILRGSFAALEDADCAMAGGHSIADAELKFGLAVTGYVHPDKILTNSGAQPGDRLILTKPLGIGCLTMAIKRGTAAPEHVEAGHAVMGRLNRRAAEAMVRHGAHAATDVTGYGLAGHAFEMAEGAGVSISIRVESLPVLEEARPYVSADYSCGGAKRNEGFATDHMDVRTGVSEVDRLLVFDVQTSGGLLIAVPESACDALIADIKGGGDVHAAVIGEILSKGPRIVVA
jgi:selenide,water dikinase